MEEIVAQECRPIFGGLYQFVSTGDGVGLDDTRLVFLETTYI